MCKLFLRIQQEIKQSEAENGALRLLLFTFPLGGFCERSILYYLYSPMH